MAEKRRVMEVSVVARERNVMNVMNVMNGLIEC